jgi:hypothetical protein
VGLVRRLREKWELPKELPKVTEKASELQVSPEVTNLISESIQIFDIHYGQENDSTTDEKIFSVVAAQSYIARGTKASLAKVDNLPLVLSNTKSLLENIISRDSISKSSKQRINGILNDVDRYISS